MEPVTHTSDMRGAMLGLWMLGMSGCVSVGGSVARPTALEHQLLGVYQDLDDDLVYASSVRGRDLGTVSKHDDLRHGAMRARALQLFNEDELSELKDEKCVAETREAQLLVHQCDVSEEDKDSFEARRTRVIRDENAARSRILEWAAYILTQKSGRSGVEPTQLAQMRNTYFRLLREVARVGHLFQMEDGKFVGVTE